VEGYVFRRSTAGQNEGHTNYEPNLGVTTAGGVLQNNNKSYGLDDRGFESWQGLRIFLFTTASRPALRPLGVKRPGRETDHSSPSSTVVKKCMELYLHSPTRLHGVVLRKSAGTTLHLPFFMYNLEKCKVCLTETVSCISTT